MLRADEIHVWHIELNAYQAGKTLDSHAALVKKRNSILKQLIAYYVDQPPSEIQQSYGEHHKPYLPDSLLEFNLAHSQHHMLCAFSWENPLGIDVEIKRPVHQWKHIAKKIFTSTEYDWLCTLPGHQQMDMFFRGWTRKEAYLKMTGAGLFGKALDVVVLPEISTDCTLVDLDFQPGFACLVSRKKTNAIRLLSYSDLDDSRASN